MPEPLISIIDDDESVRRSLESLLRSLGYLAQVYGSAEAFLASGSYQSSECIISDIHMPGMSGFELKQVLDRRDCHAPVIMITGRHEPQLNEQAIASGACCLLRKPFDSRELMSCIERALTP